MLETRWSGIERLGAPRGATRGSQTGSADPHLVVIDPGLGSLVPTILRLQDPKILRFEYPKIRKPLSSLKTPLILRYNFEAPLTLRSSHSASQLGGPNGPADIPFQFMSRYDNEHSL